MAQQSKTVESSAILKRIGLTLPPSAHVEYAEKMSGQDDSARLILVVKQDDWRSWEKQISVKAAEQLVFSQDDNFHLGSDEKSWQPSKAVGLKTLQLPWNNGIESLNLGIADAASGQVRLFVFWHQL